ncbi:DUF2795 domain-containing protein [Bowmanella dokdonensis]|uniref:DUF2795 domain-containing protein n=1 Tax=Bowmanella dokdonensis TaxID=751969 RepID=A0A939DQ98_9ALTE|nr:DUF2795 domain-containing protein [Bowmanella dokdonensis]MBN7826392.1 DUF2795 domain-containing protein [Bowmanella dokdonensis]
MAQFTCEHCGQEFEQRSRYEKHLQTAHPPRAISAADLEEQISGIEFPCSRQTLVEQARQRHSDGIASLLTRLPDNHFRDAAEVARSLGELKSHKAKADVQPSKKGGKEALKRGSASHIASLFGGLKFPASAQKLRNYAQQQATDKDKQMLQQFREKQYQDMADVAREFGRIKSSRSD